MTKVRETLSRYSACVLALCDAAEDEMTPAEVRPFLHGVLEATDELMNLFLKQYEGQGS